MCCKPSSDNCCDSKPPELVRWDTFPGATVCGPVDIIGNVTDVADADVDPTGVAEIWVTLDGNQIASFTPRAECPEAVEFSFTELEITGTGALALHAEDCEGNAAILKQVVVQAAYDEDPPVVTVITPSDDGITCEDSQIIEVDVASDNDDLVVCLTIDGFDIGCDSIPPYRWIVNLDPGLHLANITAIDGCGMEGSAEITFLVSYDDVAPEVSIIDPGNIECMPHDILAEVTDDIGVLDVWMEIDGYVGSFLGEFIEGDTYKFHVTNGLENGPNLITVYANDTCSNLGDDDFAVNFSCPGPVIEWIYPEVCGQLLCELNDEYCLEVSVGFRELPSVECVEFYFDGSQSPFCIDCDGSDGWTCCVDNSGGFGAGGHQVAARAKLVDIDGNVSWVWSETCSFIINCPPVAVLELVDYDLPTRTFNLTGEGSWDDNTEPAMTYEFECLSCLDYTVTQSSTIDPTVTMTLDESCGELDEVEFKLTATDGWGLFDEAFLTVDIE